MCVYTNMTTLLVQDGYLGLHDNSGVDFYERSKGEYRPDKGNCMKIPNDVYEFHFELNFPG